MKKTIKMIVSDMDGTLLSPEGKLDPLFFQLHKKMEQKGIIFVAASGRQFYNLNNVFAPIRDKIYFIAENGNYVRYLDQELMVVDIPSDRLDHIIDQIRTIDRAYPVLCGKDSAYIEKRSNPDFEAFASEGGKYYDRCEVVQDLKEVIQRDRILKVAIYDFLGSSTNCGPMLEHFNDTLKVVISGKSWCDISHQDANKGVALDFVQRRLGIKANETIAFGDQMNDAQMLEHAYYSYAVENAVDGIKSIARFKSLSNRDNGVMKILEDLLK